MNLKELISSVETHLEDRLPVQVQVKNDSDKQPSPAVLIEGWDVENISQENMRYEESRYDSDGTEVKRIYTLPYEVRLDFLVSHGGAVEATELHDSLRKEIMKLEVSPTELSDEVSMVKLGSGGGISYQFASPSESEMTQSASFTTQMVYVDDKLQNIENIVVDVDIVDNI